MRGVDEPGETGLRGVLEDEGLHKVVAVVPVQEVVEDGVDAAVDQREALRQVQRHVQEVLQAAAEGQDIEQRERVQQEDGMERKPAHQEDHDVDEDDPAADAPLLVRAGGDGRCQEQVEDSNDGEGDGKAEND